MKDTTARPMVSIVVPAYNADKFLAETLDSLLKVDYPAFEIIVVDDGSTDQTASVAEDFCHRDARVHLLKQENGGVCRARNHGIRQAQGKYILPVDADDLVLPDFVSWAVDELERNPEVKVAIPKAEFFGARTGTWHLPPFSIHLLARKNMIPATALYRKTDWERTGGYYEAMQAREDWEFWVNVLKTGGTVVTSPRLGLRYRIHEHSKRTTDRRMKRKVVDALNMRHPEFFQRELGGPLHYHRSWSRVLNLFHRILFPHNLVVAEGFQKNRDFFLALPQLFKTERGTIIYNRRNQLRSLTYDGHDYVVKSFHTPNLLNRIVYGFLRPSKAKRSYRYSLLLQQRGIGVPQPVAYYTERTLGLFFGRSYYVSLLSELPYTYNNIIAGTLPADEEDVFLRVIAQTTARLHEAGMVHLDYSRGNILFGRDAEGHPQVEIIDLNRIRFHKVSMEEGCYNFAERLPATDSQRRTMAEEYARHRGFDPEECLRLMVAGNKEKE